MNNPEYKIPNDGEVVGKGISNGWEFTDVYDAKIGNVVRCFESKGFFMKEGSVVLQPTRFSHVNNRGEWEE